MWAVGINFYAYKRMYHTKLSPTFAAWDGMDTMGFSVLCDKDDLEAWRV